MKKLLELESRLRKAKEELEKSLLGDMNPVQKMDGETGMPAGTAGGGDVNVAKDEEIKGCEDKDKAKKIMEEEMDEHNEKKHGEAKDEDSAKKSDIPKMRGGESVTDQTTTEIVDQTKAQGASIKGGGKPKPKSKELIKFDTNGQWSLTKATMDAKPNGEFDVPVKEVHDGDDEFVHVGSRSVDGDKPGRERKVSDDEKKMVKE